jgi:hypothetical protein
MRKRSTSVLVLATALAIAVAGISIAHPPTVIIDPPLELILNGGISPTKLPKDKLAPLHLNVEGTINRLDGQHVQPAKEIVVETDKNGTINAKGLPICAIGKIVATTTQAALKACRPALVGEGKTNVEVEFAESPKFLAHSKLLAFNAGVKGGVTTILIHAYLSSPVSAAVITTVKVSKIHRGPYGTRGVATIPVIAGGAGSAKEFQLEFFKTFTYKGKKQSYLLAKCPSGKLKAYAEAIFGDGHKLGGALSRPCTPKG